MIDRKRSIYGLIPQEWPLVTLGDLVQNQRAELQTGPFGTMLHASSYRPSGTPVVAVQHIGENRIRHTDLPRIDDNTRDRLDRYRLQTGDIVFGRKGAVERRALVQPEEAGWLQGSDCIRLRLLDHEIDPRYVSYVLGTAAYRAWIVQHAHGATMPSLNQEIIGLIPMPLPPFSEQRAISSALGALDDKIELNRRMNETLEAMARALFKSWFVDFDPTEKSFEQLQYAPLGEVAALSREGVNPGDFPLEHFDHFSLPAFDEGRNPKHESGAAIKSNKFRIPADAVLVSKLNPRIPRIWLPKVDSTTAVASTEYLVLQPKPVISREYLYCLCSSAAFMDAVAERVTGTSGSHQRARPEDVLGIVVPYPPMTIMRRFTAQSAPWLELIQVKQEESRSLASIRDALLPKLLSGDIRVAIGDELVGATAEAAL